MKSSSVVLSLFLAVSITQVSFSTQLESFLDLDTELMASDYVRKNQVLKGGWTVGNEWKGVVCPGSYRFRFFAQGVLEKVNFEPKSDTVMEVSGRIGTGKASVDGKYKSELSFCNNLQGGLGIGADSIEVRSLVEMDDNSPRMNITVQEIKFGTIHIGNSLPAWFEEVLTHELNRGLAALWKTSLGNWIQARINDYINKNVRPTEG